MPTVSRRRRGHRETPIIVGLIGLLGVSLSGFAHLARAAERAKKAGLILGASERWLAFGRGCLFALGTVAAIVLVLANWVGITILLDNRRSKL